MKDLELDAMQTITLALATLNDEDAVKRVIQWAASRHGVSLATANVRGTKESGAQIDERSGPDSEFDDIADLFDAASPSTEPEKTLIVGYWFQVIQGQSDIDSLSINSELKNLGHGVSNITKAFESLINRKPRLVIQTKKSGTSQQARKRYKLTVEGIRVVTGMLNRKSSLTDE